MLSFLNERSLEPYTDWSASLTLFWRAASELGSAKVSLYRDSHFFESSLFKARFSALSLASDLRGLVREMVFGNRYFACWRPERQSNAEDVYQCVDPPTELLDESLAEAAERKFRDTDDEVSVISAADSAFASLDRVEIQKLVSGDLTHVMNIVSIDRVRAWIADQPGFYDRTSLFPPKDHQTVLEKQSERFIPTKHRELSGRRIFREANTARQYYVDNLHRGLDAHLEVFDAGGSHLGEADVDSGTLVPRTAVKGRVLRR
jgi:hypothetical protein